MRPFFIFLFAAQSHAAVTLDESFRAALSKSETVGQSRQIVAQADEKISQIRGGILPEVTFNAFHFIQTEPSDPIARSFSPQHQTTLSFGLAQPLFRGFREFAGLRGQKHLREARAFDAVQVTARLYLDLAANYLNILALEQDLVNLGEQSAVYEERVADLGGRAKRGESAETEVLTARSTQASLLAEMRLVEGQLGAARESYHFLTGLPQETPLQDPDVLKAGESAVLPVETYLARIEERPDIKALRESYQASDENVSVAWGAHWPRADLVANYYLKRPGFLSDLRWDVGFKLTIPLFEGGATQAKVREAIARRAESELELARARRAAGQEIRSLRQRVMARLHHLDTLKASVELAEKNSRLMRRDYGRALARNIDVQLALSDLRGFRRSYDQSRFAAELELLQLRVAAWEGLPQ